MKRRRGEVDLSLLPPIASLVPEELKNYTKEELSAYLESKGIQPKFTKPEMKRQLRLVIQAIKEDQPEILQKLREDGLRELVETPKKLSRPGDFMRHGQRAAAAAAAAAAGAGAGDEDKRPCMSPGCRKKANRDCEFQRCRSCCARDGYLCYVHMHDLGRRGHESALYKDHPFVNGTAQISSLLPSLTKAPSRSSSIYGRGPMPAPSSPGPVETAPQLPPPPIRQWAKICPSCSKKVFGGGANFLLHLRECSAEHFEHYLTFGGDIDPDGGLGTDPANSGIGAGAHPLVHAKARAYSRFLRRDEFFQTIFSPEPLEEVIHELTNDYLQNERLLTTQRFQQQLEALLTERTEADDAHELQVDERRLQTEVFAQHLARLENASSLAEVEDVAADFYQDFGTPATQKTSCPLPSVDFAPAHEVLSL